MSNESKTSPDAPREPRRPAKSCFTSVTLTAQELRAIQTIADRNGVSQADAIEMAVRRLARERLAAGSYQYIIRSTRRPQVDDQVAESQVAPPEDQSAQPGEAKPVM